MFHTLSLVLLSGVVFAPRRASLVDFGREERREELSLSISHYSNPDGGAGDDKPKIAWKDRERTESEEELLYHEI